MVDEPASSVDQFLSQIASTKLVVATRFHGAVLSFVCGKPTICISFHEKCSALMRAMGMDEYCLPMNGLTVDQLIDAFRRLDEAAPLLASLIHERTSSFRSALNEQYEQILAGSSAPLPLAEQPSAVNTWSWARRSKLDAVRERMTGRAGGIVAALAVAVSAAVALVGAEASSAATLPSGFTEQTVFTGLNAPVNFRSAADGRIFVAQKGGVIKEYDNLSDTTPTTVTDQHRHH